MKFCVHLLRPDGTDPPDGKAPLVTADTWESAAVEAVHGVRDDCWEGSWLQSPCRVKVVNMDVRGERPAKQFLVRWSGSPDRYTTEEIP